MPIMPRFSGCDAGNPPMPSSVGDTGMFAFSANARTMSMAPESMMPWPARMMGRSAPLISSSARWNSAGFALQSGRKRGLLRRRGIPVELARRLLRVFRDVDVNRARTSRRGDVERLTERRRNFVRARHQVVVLGNRQRDAGHVGFLKRIGPDELAAHLAGDAHDRRRVQHRRRDAGHHVRGAGARGGDRDTDSAARPRVAVGHVRGALLVAHEDVADGIIEHGVVGRQNRPARIAEHVGHSLPHETFPDNLRACLSSYVLFYWFAWGPTPMRLPSLTLRILK